MTVLFAFLAGMSFVIAVLAAVIAIAEHYRAERVEQALLAMQETHRALILEHSADLVKLAQQGVTFAEQDERLSRLIAAVAAASSPPAIPVGQVHIVVPGPRTQQ